MLFFAFLLCLQACLLQNVFGQCIRPYTTGLAPVAELASPLSRDAALAIIAAPFATSVTIPFTEPFLVSAAAVPFGAYGGAGIGEIIAAGDLPAAGTTIVAGQVPVLGAVKFEGIVPAAGAVSIIGSCSCGCDGRLVF